MKLFLSQLRYLEQILCNSFAIPLQFLCNFFAIPLQFLWNAFFWNLGDFRGIGNVICNEMKLFQNQLRCLEQILWNFLWNSKGMRSFEMRSFGMAFFWNLGDFRGIDYVICNGMNLFLNQLRYLEQILWNSFGSTLECVPLELLWNAFLWNVFLWNAFFWNLGDFRGN